MHPNDILICLLLAIYLVYTFKYGRPSFFDSEDDEDIERAGRYLYWIGLIVQRFSKSRTIKTQAQIFHTLGAFQSTNSSSNKFLTTLAVAHLLGGWYNVYMMWTNEMWFDGAGNWPA